MITDKIRFIWWILKFRFHLSKTLNRKQRKSEIKEWLFYPCGNMRNWKEYTPYEAARKFSQYHWE